MNEKKIWIFFEKISENGRGRPRPSWESEIFFLILLTSPVVSTTTSNKKFQKIRYRSPYSSCQTDGQTDRRMDTHSEIINIDNARHDI